MTDENEAAPKSGDGSDDPTSILDAAALRELDELHTKLKCKGKSAFVLCVKAHMHLLSTQSWLWILELLYEYFTCSNQYIRVHCYLLRRARAGAHELSVLEFEKDDDSNSHIDFVAATAVCLWFWTGYVERRAFEDRAQARAF